MQYPLWQIRPMWSRQGLRTTPPGSSSFHGHALRPFSSSCDQLGRPMSRAVLSRSTAGLKPQQFDTTQRRSEYTCALVDKREARLAREAEEVVASQLVREPTADCGKPMVYDFNYTPGTCLVCFMVWAWWRISCSFRFNHR